MERYFIKNKYLIKTIEGACDEEHRVEVPEDGIYDHYIVNGLHVRIYNDEKRSETVISDEESEPRDHDLTSLRVNAITLERSRDLLTDRETIDMLSLGSQSFLISYELHGLHMIEQYDLCLTKECDVPGFLGTVSTEEEEQNFDEYLSKALEQTDDSSCLQVYEEAIKLYKKVEDVEKAIDEQDKDGVNKARRAVLLRLFGENRKLEEELGNKRNRKSL